MITEWQTTETMPRDGRKVLACNAEQHEVAVIEATDWTVQFWTHWAPIPDFWK